jgi:hypothetical protein
MPSSFAAVPPRIATRWSSPSAAPARCAIRCRGEEPGRFPRRGRVELGTHRRYRRRPRPLRAPPRLSVPGQEHRRKLAGHSRRGGRRRPIYRRVDLRHEPFGLARRRRNQRFHPGTGGHRQRGGRVDNSTRSNSPKSMQAHPGPMKLPGVHGYHLRCVQYRTRLRGPPGHQRLGLQLQGGQPARLL